MTKRIIVHIANDIVRRHSTVPGGGQQLNAFNALGAIARQEYGIPGTAKYQLNKTLELLRVLKKGNIDFAATDHTGRTAAQILAGGESIEKSDAVPEYNKARPLHSTAHLLNYLEKRPDENHFTLLHMYETAVKADIPTVTFYKATPNVKKSR